MNRNEFLKVLGFGTTGLIVPDMSFLSSKKIKIYDNYIKGIAHYDYPKLKSTLKTGDQLTLHRDFENQYDSFAISVYFGAYKLGYIAAYENVVLSNLMEQGVELFAFVSENLKSSRLYNDVAMEIYAEIVISNQTVIQTSNLAQHADDISDIYRTRF